MARVALLCPDLMFGSKVEGGLRAAGHEVELFDHHVGARAGLLGSDVFVLDLTGGYDGPGLVESMKMSGVLEGVPVLGFYPHVDQETRRRAEAAGCDLVVPRSRMAREMGALVERLLAGRATPPEGPESTPPAGPEPSPPATSESPPPAGPESTPPEGSGR